MSRKKNQRTSTPEKADRGNFFSVYPDPVGMRTDHKPQSDVREHLQMRDLLQEGARQQFIQRTAAAELPGQSAVTPRAYIPQKQTTGGRCPLCAGLHNKSPCVIVQQRTATSRAGAVRRRRRWRRRTVMAAGGAVRYSPFRPW